MRVLKEPSERKQEILQAAIRVFTRKSYDRTSIADIARELNISQGLCYRYFPSKEAIYDAAIDEYAEYIARGNAYKADADGGTLREQILRMSGRTDTYASTEKDQSDLYELFHHPGSERMHEQLAMRVARKLLPVFTNALKAAKERGEITLSDPAAAACFMVYGQMAILTDPRIPAEEKTERIQRCMLELLQL